ncbi:hypothetical protein H2248_002375 [Termitomyces sp. 'cryptogamus']|nr:hypothetical protein H2248_002375 [Termitomyces sp. 'cryptogamus']
MLVFPPPMLEKLVNVTQKWSERTGEKEAMMQVLTTGPDGKASNFPSCVVELFYVLSWLKDVKIPKLSSTLVLLPISLRKIHTKSSTRYRAKSNSTGKGCI